VLTIPRLKPTEIVSQVPQLGISGGGVLPSCPCPPDVEHVRPVGLVLECDGIILDQTVFAPGFCSKVGYSEFDEAFVLDEREDVFSLWARGQLRGSQNGGKRHGAYQDAQEAVEAVIGSLPQEESGCLLPEELLVMSMNSGSGGSDVFE
jgi:hypothetical protein